MSRSSTSLVLVVVALLTAPLAGAANGAPTASGPSKQAIRAVTLRGQALNQTYHLGQYAGPSKQDIRALTLRGQALNQTYHLGQYAGPSKQDDPRPHAPRPGAQPDVPPRPVRRRDR